MASNKQRTARVGQGKQPRWLAMAAGIAVTLLISGPLPAVASESGVACSDVQYARQPLEGPIAPPNPEGPTRVAAGFFVTGLSEIDAVNDRFHFRGAVRVIWCDPRLAFEPAPGEAAERIHLNADAEAQFQEIWSPAGILTNRLGTFEIYDRVLRIEPDGTVHSQLHLAADVSALFDLRRFPFDSQVLELHVESLVSDSKQMLFVSQDSVTGFADDFAIPEWRITRVQGHVEDALSMRSPKPFSRFVLEIEIERKAGFYLWKVFLPLAMIVGLSWSVFWMSDETLASRTRITATGVLTIVAYQFVVGEGLPRIAYLTLLDKVMILSFAVLAVTVLQSMIVSRARRVDEAHALRIDRKSRWLFPTVYVAMIVILVTTTGGT